MRIGVASSPEDKGHEIESRSDEEILALLQGAGIFENSRDPHDYVKAKKLMFAGAFIDPNIYEWQIRVISDYLQV